MQLYQYLSFFSCQDNDNSKLAECLLLKKQQLDLEFIPGRVEHHLDHNERLNCLEIQGNQKTFSCFVGNTIKMSHWENSL